MGGARVSFSKLVQQAESLRGYNNFEAYYDGEVRLDALGVSLPPEVRILEMVAPWPSLAVDVLSEVLRVDGFKHEDKKVTSKLRKWWQANDLDTNIPLGITEALVQGAGYLIVGPGRAGTPRISVHQPSGMAVGYDHMGDVNEAVRRYSVGDIEHAAHYQPGVTTYYRRGSGGWSELSRKETGIPRIPVIPMLNKVRLGDTSGRSEMLQVMKLADAGSRSLTNLQVAQELLALPQRYMLGSGVNEFKKPDGTMASKLDVYLGYLLTGPADGKVGQLPGADLSQIINTIKLYAQMVSSITGIPPSMLGISTDNPASAEAMRAAKERLISKAEAKQALFGDAIEEAMRVALMMDGVAEDGLESLETVWRDPATPSQSAKAANGLQAHAQGVISSTTARDFLQLTPAQKQAEDARDTRFRDALGRAGL